MHTKNKNNTKALNEALQYSEKALNQMPDNEKAKKQYTRIKQKLSQLNKN
jgi:hypothetical protein